MRIEYPREEFMVTVTYSSGDRDWHEGGYAECCEWLTAQKDIQSASLNKIIARSGGGSGNGV